MKRIWMVGAWGDNFGDRILQKANADLLREYFKCDIAYVNCQKTYFSKNLISSINRNADLLFIAGGGLLFHRPMDLSLSGWQFNIAKEDLKLLQVPIVVNAIGYNRFPHQEDFKAGMWEHLQETINRSTLFSVRNSGTFNTLKHNGIDTSRVQITPDCGCFIKSEPFEHPIFNTGFKVGLNWATDRIQQRFGANWENKLNLVLDVCVDLVNSFGATIYLIEHLMPNELNAETKLKTREIFKERLGTNGKVLFEECNRELYPMFDYHAPFFADLYKQMDLVLGMRGHSGIVSFRMNTPFIGLGQHNKIKWFMEDVGLAEWIVRLDKTDEEDYTELKAKVDKMLCNAAEIKCNIKKSYEIEERTKNRWFDQIADILK